MKTSGNFWICGVLLLASATLAAKPAPVIINNVTELFNTSGSPGEFVLGKSIPIFSAASLFAKIRAEVRLQDEFESAAAASERVAALPIFKKHYLVGPLSKKDVSITYNADQGAIEIERFSFFNDAIPDFRNLLLKNNSAYINDTVGTNGFGATISMAEFGGAIYEISCAKESQCNEFFKVVIPVPAETARREFGTYEYYWAVKLSPGSVETSYDDHIPYFSPPYSDDKIRTKATLETRAIFVGRRKEIVVEDLALVVLGPGRVVIKVRLTGDYDPYK